MSMSPLLPCLLILAAAAAGPAPAKESAPARPTTFRKSADGSLRGSDGEVLRRSADGSVRSSEGSVARRSADGSVRFSDGQTVRAMADGSLRTSDGVSLRRMADGSWQGSDGTRIRTQADGSVVVAPPSRGGRIDPARAALLTQPALGQDPRLPAPSPWGRNTAAGPDKKPGG